MKVSITFTTLILVMLLGCNLLIDSSDDNSPTIKTIYDNGFEYTLLIPKNVFAIDDSLSLIYNVKNQSLVNREFNFANIQQFGFKIVDESNRIALSYPNIVSPSTSRFFLRPVRQRSFQYLYSLKILVEIT